MTKAHSGSLLPIKNGIIIPVEYEDYLWSFYWNKVSGRGHEPITDISTIVRDDKFGYALAVEDGTTNLLGSAELITTTRTPHTGTVSIDTQDSPCGDTVVKWTTTHSDDYTTPYSGDFTASSGQSYTVSIWARGDVGGEGISFFLFDYWNDGTTSGRANHYTNITLTKQWKRYKFTINTSTYTYAVDTRIDLNGTTSGVTAYFSGWQLEEKSWATSFVNGTRASGEFALTKEIINPKSFTVNTWIKHNTLPSTITVPSSGRVPIFEVSHGISSTNRLVMGFRGDDILDVWVGNTVSTNNTGITTLYKAVKGTWTMYSITFDSGVYRIYVNGSLVKSQSAVQFTTTDTTTLNIGSKHHGILNGLVSNFMISPRAWSDQAIKAIYEYGRPLYDPHCYYSTWG